MAEFAPPSGPPPPKLPEGWKAVWNDQYSEYFYVNIHTKKSQWDKPTEPAYPAGEAPPAGPPPSYSHPPSASTPETSEKSSSFASNNPYGSPNVSEDERLARQLQEEEEARARGHSSGGVGGAGGAASSYYNQSPGQGAYPNPGGSSSSGYVDLGPPQQEKKKGLLGKLMGKASSHHGHQSRPQGYPVGGAYGQQPMGSYGQPMGYGAPMGGGGTYGRPMGGGRTGGGGMGAMGAGALGLGGGLLAGGLIGEAMGDAGDRGDTYVENNYGDDGGDMGGDFGGGDMGGGDF